ncbi:MAG: bile acid:sodium symporter family protein [Verrucomicrobiales bacterium]|nr:bile acid:sodium symporter family protein [Verrucomicrobiales bacterium]
MIVKVLLPLILAFIMFSLGLGLRGKDFSRVIQFPRAFTMGLLNQLVLLPLVAFGIILLFKPAPELAVGIMILSLCPGGVTSNVLTRLANGNTPLSISMTAIVSLVSIVTVPLLVALSVRHFMGVDGPEVNVTRLGIQMFLITAVPVGLGMLLTRNVPQLVGIIAKGVSRTALVLFVFLIVAALAKNWEVFSSNLPNLGPALILLNVILLALGLATAKIIRLDPKDSTTIAIESGIQNGTLAIAVGALIAASETETLPPTTVPAAVYGITMYLVSVPFVWWRRRKQ